MIKIISFSLIAFLAIQKMRAQSTFVSGLFPTIDHAGTVTKKMDYSFYYFGAFPLLNFNSPSIKENSKVLLLYSEQALTYNLNKRISITGSYVFQRENTSEENYTNENRIYVQSTYKHSLKDVNFKHRLRFDNRFIQNKETEKTPFTHRLRYLIGIDFPLRSKKSNLYFSLYEEAFFNTFKSAGSVFGENWAYAALGIKLNKNSKLEAGPLYITWNTGANNWFHQYYLQFTWISYFNFSKPKE